MRKIIAGMFITLDGVTEAPENWNPPYYSEEMGEVVQAQIAGCATHLYGRRTYELFQSVFDGPAAEQIPHAKLMTETPKVVVSTTLRNPSWGPTTLISDNVIGQLSALKEEADTDINVGASGTLVRFLIRENLLDEITLHVHPVVLGRGKRLFEEAPAATLELLAERAFANGVVSLRYRVAS